MPKYLDSDGVAYLWRKLKNNLSNKMVYYSKKRADWDADRDMVSQKDVLYIYSDYKLIEQDGKQIYIPGIKIGDGTSYLIDLPFANQNKNSEIEDLLLDHINNKIVHISAEQRDFWNNKTSNTGTVTSVAISNDINGGLTVSGSPITSSGTVKLKHTNQVTAQNTQAIYPIKIDVNGHISAYGSAVTPLTASSTLDATKLSGTIPTTCLPSYVDDVLEYTAKVNFPATGQQGKIYVDKTTNLTWRWSGSAYVQISPSLALGTTSSTAFRGDYGNTAYTHAVTNKGSAFNSGLYKITTNSEGHVTAATAVQKSDITDLGIPGINTVTTVTITGNGNAVTSVTASNGALTVTKDSTFLTGGSNAASAVTITPITTDVYSMTSAGNVILPTLTFAMDTTDTKKLKITFEQGSVTLPGRSSVIKAWTGYIAATAAAQAFTGNSEPGVNSSSSDIVGEGLVDYMILKQ